MGDLVLRLRVLKLISKSCLIKLKFMIFNGYEIFITIVLQTCFQGISIRILRDKVFLVSKKDCVTVSNTHVIRNT